MTTSFSVLVIPDDGDLRSKDGFGVAVNAMSWAALEARLIFKQNRNAQSVEAIVIKHGHAMRDFCRIIRRK